MKRLPVSPAVRQLRVTTATSYHIIPVTVSMIRKEGWGGRQKGARAHGWLECIVRQPLQKNSMEISHKIQKELLWIQLCCFWVCIWEGSLLSISERYLYCRISHSSQGMEKKGPCTDEKRGDGSVGKLLVLKVWGLEFNQLRINLGVCWWGGHRRIPWCHWPVSLT